MRLSICERNYASPVSDILKPQTTAECNQLSAISIDAEDSAGINSFNNFHVSPPLNRTRLPKQNPTINVDRCCFRSLA